jgi:hypothetical protein
MTRTARRAEPGAHEPARPLVAFALARALARTLRAIGASITSHAPGVPVVLLPGWESRNPGGWGEGKRCRQRWHLAQSRRLAGPSPRTGRLGIAAWLEHLLRRLGAAFLFATFGAGAVVLAGVVIPLTTQPSRTREAPDLAAQRIIHRAFQLFVRLGTGLRLFALSESGTERLREGPGLVVANHPTPLDVVFLIPCMPQADCIVKREV